MAQWQQRGNKYFNVLANGREFEATTSEQITRAKAALAATARKAAKKQVITPTEKPDTSSMIGLADFYKGQGINPSFDAATKRITAGDMTFNKDDVSIVDGRSYIDPMKLASNYTGKLAQVPQMNEKTLQPYIDTQKSALKPLFDSEMSALSNEYDAGVARLNNALEGQKKSLRGNAISRGVYDSGTYDENQEQLVGDFAPEFANLEKAKTQGVGALEAQFLNNAITGAMGQFDKDTANKKDAIGNIISNLTKIAQENRLNEKNNLLGNKDALNNLKNIGLGVKYYADGSYELVPTTQATHYENQDTVAQQKADTYDKSVDNKYEIDKAKLTLDKARLDWSKESKRISQAASSASKNIKSENQAREALSYSNLAKLMLKLGQMTPTDANAYIKQNQNVIYGGIDNGGILIGKHQKYLSDMINNKINKKSSKFDATKYVK